MANENNVRDVAVVVDMITGDLFSTDGLKIIHLSYHDFTKSRHVLCLPIRIEYPLGWKFGIWDMNCKYPCKYSVRKK